MRKMVKRLSLVLACVLALSMFVPTDIGTQTGILKSVEAAVKINKTTKSLAVGQTYQLKVSGTSKKVTWSTSNKKVVTVTSKGKICAKKAGTATVTAKVGSKKYKCKVTVKRNYKSYSLTNQRSRKTGYYNGQPTAEIKLVSMEYFGDGSLKVILQFRNIVQKKCIIRQLKNIHFKTKKGTALTKVCSVYNATGFSLNPGESKTLGLTIKGSNVKKVVNLRSADVLYTVDFFYEGQKPAG